jgi:hypothetical protein
MKKLSTKIFFWFTLFMFVLGFFLCLNPKSNKEYFSEMMSGTIEPSQDTETVVNEQSQTTNCPNILIKSGNRLLLQNTNLPKSDSNPLVFSNLDEYIGYTKKQREQGIRCPVLFLQEESNTQGESVYRMRPSPFSLEGGITPTTTNQIPAELMDATRDNPPYNQNNYPSFDPRGLDVGKYTVLDQVHDSTKRVGLSDNPMDPNWGGVIHSQQMVDSGKYDDRIVGKPTMVPKVIEIMK